MHRLSALVVALAVSHAAVGFEIDAPPLMAGQPVHEFITREAVRGVSESLGVAVSEVARDAIVAGAVNPDTQVMPHKLGRDLHDYHVNNAHPGNGQFERSFALIRSLVAEAIELSRSNPRTLDPAGVGFGGFGPVLADACASSDTVCSALGALSGLPGVLSIDHTADPHTDGHPLTIARGLLPQLTAVAAPAQRPELERLRQELDGYLARQLMGHAFHALQDIFAHSNFVELVNGRDGPPCGRARPGRTGLCDQAVDGEPARFGDPRVEPFLSRLGNGFDLRMAAFSQPLGSRSARLQSGFVDLVYGRNMCPDVADLPDGFDYCHWSSRRHPALNKDGSGDGEASHASHGYARRLALFASEIMWEHYLRKSGLAAPVGLQPRSVSVSEGGGRLRRARPALVFSVPRPFTTLTRFEVRLAGADARAGARCAPNVDFVATTATGILERGATTARVPVTICPDDLVEGNERLIASVSGDHVATARLFVTLADDDRHPVPVLERVDVAPASTRLTRPLAVRLVLTGRSFQRSSIAELDGRKLRVEYRSATTLYATLPQGTPRGTHSLRVITPNGGASQPVRFRTGTGNSKASRR